VQYVQGGSASAAGLELAPFGLGLGLSATASGRLVARYGPRVVLLSGLITAAAGFVPLLFLSADSSAALVLLGAGVFGCGLGLMAPPATAVIMNDCGTAKAGDGAAVNQLSRQVGGALGVAIVGSVFAAIYAAEITNDSGVPAAAEESIQQATDVAGRLSGAARVDLLSDAVSSFDVAARWGFAVCVAVLLLSAAWAAVGLSGPSGRIRS
jgi:Na+/melibiose symporter-like transporter